MTIRATARVLTTRRNSVSVRRARWHDEHLNPTCAEEDDPGEVNDQHRRHQINLVIQFGSQQRGGEQIDFPADPHERDASCDPLDGDADQVRGMDMKTAV